MSLIIFLAVFLQFHLLKLGHAQGDVCNVTRPLKVLSMSSAPTPIPTAHPLWTQSSPPSSQVPVWPPTRAPVTANPTSMPSSDCLHEMHAIEDINASVSSVRPDALPIQITGQDGGSVTFIVNQVWKKDESVSWMATELKHPSLGWNCLRLDSVPFGPVRKFTASCDASGWATVKLYVHDGSGTRPVNDSAIVPLYCSPTPDFGATTMNAYKVPCNPGCYPMPTECTNEAELDYAVGVLRYNSTPIEILSQDWTNVTFRVLQTWIALPICSIATSYPSAMNGAACDLVEAVKPGSGGTYVAKCQGGSASVSVYVHDTSLDRPSNSAKMPPICQSSTNDRIASYTFRIPCGRPSSVCVPDAELSCDSGDDYVVSFEDFESNQHLSWTFGSQGRSSVYGRFLGPLSSQLQEVFKVQHVPQSNAFTSLEFTLLTFGNWTSNDKVFARIRNQYLDLLSFLGSLASRSGLFGDLKVSLQQVPPAAAPTMRAVSVNITVPRRWYEDGHLLFGFKVSLSNETQSKSAGVDDIMITALCN